MTYACQANISYDICSAKQTFVMAYAVPSKHLLWHMQCQVIICYNICMPSKHLLWHMYAKQTFVTWHICCAKQKLIMTYAVPSKHLLWHMQCQANTRYDICSAKQTLVMTYAVTSKHLSWHMLCQVTTYFG